MELPVLNDTSAVLPPLYARWMDELLPGPIPAETEATCDDCAMCADGPTRPGGTEYYFDPRAKCCTFIPELPNFTVGAVLCDEAPAFASGRKTLEARLATDVAVTPLGVGRSPTESFLYARLTEVGGFGRNPDLLCPHYLASEGGRCGIWRHRTSVCCTWFCKHVRGELGRVFWRNVQLVLAEAESNLIHWCVVELDPGLEALRRLYPIAGVRPSDVDVAGHLDGRLRGPSRDVLWGRWAGRETDFYRECAHRVQGLCWSDVRTICGPHLAVAERMLKESYAQLRSGDLPQRLRAAPFQVLHAREDSFQLVCSNMLDPIDVPRALVQSLHYFDGRPTLHALAAIAADTGFDVQDSTVRTLVDFGVLRSA